MRLMMFLACVFYVLHVALAADDKDILEILQRQEMEIANVGKQIQKMEDMMKILQRQEMNMVNFEKQLLKLEASLNTLDTRVQTLELGKAQQGAAGFNVMKETLQPSSSDEIVVFDTELYDAGDAFNPSTGIYTCPADGVYLFSTTTHPGGGGEINCCIEVNGENYGCSFNGDNGGDVAAITVVAPCLLNQQVAVRVTWGSASVYGLYNGNPISVFSGLLVALL